MDTPAGVTIEQRDGGPVAVLHGDWTTTSLGVADRELSDAARDTPGLALDTRDVGRCDTAGAYAIAKAAQGRIPSDQIRARPEISRLLELVRSVERTEPPPAPRQEFLAELLDRVGQGAVDWVDDVVGTLAFNGRLIIVMGRAIKDPRRIRWAAFVALAERAGLDALPIVATTSFFVGAVIAFIGANMLSNLGAQVYTAELVGVGVLREFGIVITAVLLAGRSASSFAAEIGAMKMNQEIDAMRVMGVDPFEALVAPRFMALLATIPLLTFVAMAAGLAGGLVVAWSVLHLSPIFFVKRIADQVGIKHFWLGMAKAPVMAAVIAVIGCRQGMEVGGDVESLGRRVTAAVVHAIFAIILLDVIFALIYTELNV
jgi:phospholipid/cholesterol/gamma-HCH transport system permease protein